MTQLDGLLHAIVTDPFAEDRWLVLTDWLEENDDLRRAELLRLHRRLLTTCCEPDLHPERAAWQARLIGLLGQGVRPCVPQRSLVLGEGVEMTFSFIPPGSFLMGSPPEEAGRSEYETLHPVTLTTGFFLGVHPVTQAQWHAVRGRVPLGLRFKGGDLPIDRVSWDECQRFVADLARQAGARFRANGKNHVLPP